MTPTEKKYRKLVGQVVYLLDLYVNYDNKTFFKKDLVLIEDLLKFDYHRDYYFKLSFLESPDNDWRKYKASSFRFCEATTNEELITTWRDGRWHVRHIMTLDTFSKLSPDVVWNP
jgi:hypothetical protein